MVAGLHREAVHLERLTDAIHRALRMRIRRTPRGVSAHEQLLRALGDTPDDKQTRLSVRSRQCSRYAHSRLGWDARVFPLNLIATVNVVEVDVAIKVRVCTSSPRSKGCSEKIAFGTPREARPDPRFFSSSPPGPWCTHFVRVQSERGSHERIVPRHRRLHECR
jgi:hypothetical protein